MEKYIEKANVLMEAFPYIKKFAGSTIVIKYGGSVMLSEIVKKTTAADIAFLSMINIRVVIVHGGGLAINEAVKKEGLKPEFKNGVRVTDKETAVIVESILSGNINKSIVSDFLQYGLSVVGISGKDSLMIEVKKSRADIGYVGDITNVNPKIITTLIDNNFMPVISPVSADASGNTYNVNADYAAVEIAIALKATKLIFLTDVDGILEDENNPKSRISRATPDDLLKLIDKGIIKNGMIPKVKSCVKAVRNGVKSIHMINANVKHVLLLEIFTDNGIGTIIEE